MSVDDIRRPNPDDLLKGINQINEKSYRGHLRVFFGMCPGVGKTFAMLKAARELLNEDVDVVIGVVETHGRQETAEMLEGFEQIFRRQVDYRNAAFQEMDLDAILKRNPKLVLVDELAHTNAPGSRHIKRYQDVQELLLAGIDVYTTLNVQHIESRSDLVYQITGVVVQEKIPDSILDLADQIELIDLSPEVLLGRLKEGKIYLAEKVLEAEQNFFKFENIIALRELALRYTAEKVDDQLRSQMLLKKVPGIWNTSERLMVAVSSSPYSARLIRSTRRMAYNLEAPWIALYVDNGEEVLEEDQKRLQKNLSLAKELGADVIHTRDQSISGALKRVALEKNVTQIIIGRPDKRFIKDFISQGSILDQLVRETSEIDIHVIRQERKPKYKGFYLQIPKLKTGFFPYWFTFWFLIVVTFFSYAFLPWIGYRSVGFIFLLAVLGLGTLASFGPILFAASLTAIIWNYFFIPPQFTFAIKEPEDFMNLIALFVAAVVAGYFAARIKRQEKDLSERAHRSAVLYEFSQKIGDSKSISEIAKHASESISQVFGFDSSVLMKTPSGLLNPKPENTFIQNIDPKEFAVAAWSLQNFKRAGWSTDTLSSSKCLAIPLKGRSGMIGVLVLWPRKLSQLSLEQENLIETFASNLAIGFEREIFETKAKDAEVLENSEKLHQALLSSVSHELRTPLTAIVGNATALRDLRSDKKMNDNSDSTHILINDLIESSERLNRVVENLLDMTRISSGALKVKSELFEINDFVASTIERSRPICKNHKVKFTSSNEESFVKGDDQLLEHVLMNLMANALAYSSKNSEIIIKVEKEFLNVSVLVIDEGMGLPELELNKVFDRFYRSPGTPTGGTGLGLSIAKSFIEAQGGSIMVSNRKDRTGCVFKFTLPLAEFEMNMISRIK